MGPMHDGALVLFSGGQDSTACLAWALDRYPRGETVGFDYGRRQAVELQARQAVRTRIARGFPAWAPRLGEDHMIDIASFGALAETAMTSDRAIEITEKGLPSTFVPGRNLVFLTYAAALADRRGLKALGWGGSRWWRSPWRRATPAISVSGGPCMPGATAAGPARPASCASAAMRPGTRTGGPRWPAKCDELRGQRDLPDPSGRGRPGRPASRVLPLRRLQPLARTGARPRQGRLHFLRHRLRGHGRAGRGPLRGRRWARQRHRGRLDGRIRPAAGGGGRCCRSTRP